MGALPTRTDQATVRGVTDMEDLRSKILPGSTMSEPYTNEDFVSGQGANVDVSRVTPIMPLSKPDIELRKQLEISKRQGERDQSNLERTREIIEGQGERTNAHIAAILNRPRQSKLLTPEEETQQVRISGAKATATEKAKDTTGAAAMKPETIDYWASVYETTGTIPSFGMGNVGARQRKAFLDKVAERAISRGEGMDGAQQAVRIADFKASASTLTDITKRQQLINSYTVRINETADKVLVPLIKKWDLQNPRFLNWPVNKLAEVMGSGDLASLKLVLNSVSVEVGKVEFNALGIQQLTDSAAKFMKDVHDENMKVGELLKVIDTSRALGDTGMSAITKQRVSLMDHIKNIKAKQPGTNVEGTQTPITDDNPLGLNLDKLRKK